MGLTGRAVSGVAGAEIGVLAVISADRIVVIDEGRIVADGTHDELITSSDIYKRLYETQLLGT